MLNENIDGKWICSIADSEYWRSTEHFDTKEDALRGLENALESYKNGNISPISDILGYDYTSDDSYEFTLEFGNFEIGRCASPLLPDFSDIIIEMILDEMYEQVGDVSDGYLDDFSKEDKDKLNDMINDFISEKYPARFYRIDDTELVDILPEHPFK